MAKDTLDLLVLIGRPVYDSKNTYYGDVRTVHIDPERRVLDGIVVQNGADAEHYIGSRHIDSVTEHGVVLRITPVQKYVGKRVYDRKAKPVGKVKEVHVLPGTNELVSLTVTTGLGKDDLVLAEHQIADLTDHVRLSIEL